MTHPLTDKMCWEIAGTWRESSYCDGCRAASDWQLEQVIQFMEEHEKLFGGSGMIFILKDAMRPQQQEHYNDAP